MRAACCGVRSTPRGAGRSPVGGGGVSPPGLFLSLGVQGRSPAGGRLGNPRLPYTLAELALDGPRRGARARRSARRPGGARRLAALGAVDRLAGALHRPLQRVHAAAHAGNVVLLQRASDSLHVASISSFTSLGSRSPDSRSIFSAW